MDFSRKSLLSLIIVSFLVVLFVLPVGADYDYIKKVNEYVVGDYGEVKIGGFYAPQFKAVYEEFKKNIEERGEVGASVCITKKGKIAVDLYGGLADIGTGQPWEEDTISLVFSSTKGITGLALHMLIDKNHVDLDAKVTDYWPEYGQNGKENTTIRMLLAHQSGVTGFSEPLPPGTYTNWEYMIGVIERQQPFFKPGTDIGYQIYSHGWLIGEIVRRVTGRTIGEFIQEEIAGPVSADFWIGLPKEEYHRVSNMITVELVPPLADFWTVALTDPTSITAIGLWNDGGFFTAMGMNTPEYWSAEIPAAGGIGNARSLAKIYAVLANGGKLRNVKYVSEEVIAAMGRINSAGYDKNLLIQWRLSLGYAKSTDYKDFTPGNEGTMIMSEAAFGTPGGGGSIGFADSVEKVSFAYTMNQMGLPLLLNDRGQSLIDAMYIQLGYDSKKSGSWVKLKKK